MRIKSNDIVILDTTDTKKIDIHISSNHPTVQIYDTNTTQGTHTPDWSTNPLELIPIVYVDSTDVTDDMTSFLWTKIKATETTEEEVSTSKVLRISTNDLDEAPTIRYRCTVGYNGKSFSNEISFARVNTGKDGVNGNNAPAVKAQYSVSGNTGWVTTLDTSTHKYIRFSYDNGATWTSAIKMTGEDGTSVTIKGVAYAKTTPIVGSSIVLYSDVATNNLLIGIETGDSYLVDGYLCVYNANSGQFICTGKIQGPKGDQGESYYLFIRYADNTNGANISATAGNRKYIGFYRSSINVVPTDTSAATWGWTKFVGDDAKSITLSTNTQVFKVDKDNAVSPATLVITAQATNTSITEWLYSTNGGQTFSTTLPAGVVRSGNQITITGATATSNSITIRVTDGTYSDTLTVYKVFDGATGDKGADAPIAFLTNESIGFAANANGQITGTTVYCNVVAYNGTTKVTPTIGTIGGVPTGMTIGEITTTSNELIIPIIIANNATLGSALNNNGTINIPVLTPVTTNLKLSWSKVNSGPKGETGVGIRSTTVMYGVSDSASTKPADTAWQSTIPTVSDGKYLWTRTIIDYTDDTIPDTVTYTYSKQGVKGDTGSSGSSVTVSSIQYKEGVSATTAPTGTWSNSVVSVSEGNYLWTKTAFSDGKIAYGVAKQGVSGKDGVGINSTTVDYGVSDSATVKPTTWQQTIPTVAEGKYLWTRTITDYTDTSKADTVTYVYAKQGTKGETGTAGTSVTVKSIKYQAGTSATTVPTGTWSDSVVAVAEGNYLWTQTTFSDNKVAYGVAKQGEKGDKGDQGIQGPAGSNGISSYFHIKYSANANGNPMTETPSTYIGTYVDHTQADSDDYTKYTWSRFIGSQGAKGDQGIAGTNGVDGKTSYLHIAYATSSDGKTGFSVNDSVNKTYIGQYTDYTQDDSTDYTKYKWTLIKGDKGDKGDQGVQGPRGNDGQQYYTWVKYADTPTSGMSNDPTGKTYIGLAYNKTTATESTTYSDYAWSLIKGETGAVGPKGADGQQYYTWIKYADNASGANMSDLPDGKLYIGLAYNKTTSTESNVASDYTWALFKGDKGDTGRGISKITEYYLATTASSGVTTSTSGWTTTIQSVTSTNKYLWNYEVITYTDGATSPTTPVIIGVFGNTGATGKGIKSVTEYYLATNSSSGVTTSTTGWTPAMQTLTSTNKYLWNYELITYTDNSTATINPVIIGVYGDKGDKGNQGDKGNDAYTVILTNESHIFAGDVSNAIAGTTETQILAYNGSTAQSVTITSVNGKTAATTDTDTGVAGLTFKCSALSGTNPKITFTCTTAFVSKSGTIPIVLSVGGVQFTKIFTYSIAFKGSTGAQGATGQVGTPASLVNITPSAHYFKSTTGKDGTFTPDYIYLYPRFQTVTFSSWQYSINGGTTWVAASGANGLSIGTYNSVVNTLRIAKTSTLYTDAVTSISFRCVSSNASVYDTVSIAKIYDVVDLRFEGRNLVLNSNQSVTSDTYKTFVYDMSEDWIGGETYTISIKGSLNEGQTFGVWANGSATRVTTLTYDASKNIYTSTFVASTNIVTQMPKTLHVYNTPSDTATESAIEWIKLEKGSRLTNWLPAPEDLKSTTFQLYAPKGYLITKDVPEVTLETFAYDGSQPITSATFAWYSLINETWTAISGATGTSLTLNKGSVLKSNVYKCEMTYKNKVYTATATVEDKTDIYESIMCISSNATGNDCYWVLYTLVYTDAEEVDPLLGPISINAPSSPVSGDYWYSVDSANATVTLKKYNGTSWVNSTDKQSLSYYWDIVNDGSTKVPFGESSKVQVISCHDFTATATLVCKVSNVEDGLLTQSSLSLTDASDPIVSATEPVGVVDGQIWIKPNDNGTYFMSIWDATKNMWIVNDMDKRTKVYSSRPSSYNVGDLWITASDTDHGSYLGGTLLQTDTTSTTYNASHWSPTLKYDQDLDKIKETLNDLSEYVNITSEGLKIGAQNASGEISPFTSLFTSTELSFYQNSDKLLTLANNQLTAPRIVVEDDLEVHKTISLGNLKLTIEDNGSFSFAVTK